MDITFFKTGIKELRLFINNQTTGLITKQAVVTLTDKFVH